MCVKIILLLLTLGLFTSCQKEATNGGIDLPRVRIAYVLVKQKPALTNLASPPLGYNQLYVTLDEGTTSYAESQIFQELLVDEGSQFFDQLLSINQYTYLERDKTYSMALFHKSINSPNTSYNIVNNVIFKPSDYLPNPNNQFSLKNGDLELIVSIYE